MRAATPITITIDEAEVLGAGARRTIYRKLQRNEYQAIAALGASANGKAEPLLLLESLPTHVQAKYCERQHPEPPAAQAAPFNWTEVPERQSQRVLHRYQIVERALAIQAGPRGGQTAALAALAAEAGIRLDALYEWIARFRTAGVPGLLRRYGARTGRYRRLVPALQTFIKDQYLQPTRPSPTTVYLQVVECCRELKIPPPAQVTVVRFIRRAIPEAVSTYHRVGPKAFERDHEYKCHRDVSDLAVGEWICGDHKKADVWVYASDAKDAPIIRPFYTCYGDIRSRLIDGLVVDRPSSDSIKLALRQWMLQHGVPRHHYCDNGKDYECGDINGRTFQYRHCGMPANQKAKLFVPGVLNAAGITDHDAIPKKPWGKPIESWFNHVFHEWEKTLPGYCGPDAKEKPEKLAGELKRGELLTLEELSRRLAERLAEYNRTPKEVLDGASPAELWQGVTIERPHPRTLDLLLLKYKRLKVQQGKVEAFGQRGRARFYYHAALGLLNGQWVDGYYDRTNLGAIVILADGKFVCEAVNDEAMRYGASEEAFHRLAGRKRAQQLAARDWRDKHHRVLYQPEHVLSELSEDVRREQDRKKVRRLHADPGPRPGTTAIPRTIPGFDQAAAARERRAVPLAVNAPRPVQAALPERDINAELLED